MDIKITRTLPAIVLAAAFGAFGAGNAALAGGSHAHGHGGLGFGKPGNPKLADRTIEIDATDSEFSLPAIEVADGETIRFIVHNKGELVHEFNIGTPEMHTQHQAEMMMMMEHGMMTPTSLNPTMMNADHSRTAMAQSADAGSDAPSGMTTHMKHDDPNSILLAPGETKEIVWTFKKAGGLEFACNVPGHYESGMVGKLSVSD